MVVWCDVVRCMGARRNFRRGGGGKLKKGLQHGEKSSKKAPNIANKKILFLIFQGGGATAYSCPPPEGAHGGVD